MGDEVGLAAHEFLHSLGYPDLYRSSADDYPVYTWDIMGAVSSYPSWPLAYLRMYFTKWTTLDTITATTQGLTFHAPGERGKNGKEAYILQSPTNDSELFVIEMRKKGAANEPDHGLGLPDGQCGLIVYRVDTTVDRLSNFRGGTGVYVFRPDGAATQEAVQQAYLNETSKRTSLGSADMSTDLAHGALTFSNGRNSGIVIQNVKENEDGTMTCDVTFPAVESGSPWEDTSLPKTGSSVATAVHGGVVYSAVYDGSQFTLYKRDGDDWTSVGESFSARLALTPNTTLVSHDGKLYLGYLDDSGALKVRSFDVAGTGTDVTVPEGAVVNDFTMQSLDDGLYIACSTNSQAALYELDGSSFTKQKVYYDSSSGRAQVVSVGGSLYTAVRRDDQVVTVYDSAGRLVSDDSIKTPLHYSMVSLGGKVTVVTSDGTGTTVWTYDGGAWSSASDKAITSTDSRAVVIDGALYLVSSNDSGTKVYQYDASAKTWAQVGEMAVSTKADQIGLSADGEYLYISYVHDGSVYVRSKPLPASSGGGTESGGGGGGTGGETGGGGGTDPGDTEASASPSPSPSASASPTARPTTDPGAVSPDTGDETPLALYGALLLLCAAGLGLVLTGRKKEDN